MKKSYSKQHNKNFDNYINYKNVLFLKKFMTEDGKICSKKETGFSKKQQNLLSKSIKKARNYGLLLNVFNVKVN